MYMYNIEIRTLSVFCSFLGLWRPFSCPKVKTEITIRTKAHDFLYPTNSNPSFNMRRLQDKTAFLCFADFPILQWPWPRLKVKFDITIKTREYNFLYHTHLAFIILRYGPFPMHCLFPKSAVTLTSTITQFERLRCRNIKYSPWLARIILLLPSYDTNNTLTSRDKRHLVRLNKIEYCKLLCNQTLLMPLSHMTPPTLYPLLTNVTLEVVLYHADSYCHR